MLKYAIKKRESISSLKKWGNRLYPFPNNTNTLLIGNSHSRQTVYSLLCQYDDQVVDTRGLGPRGINDTLPGSFNSVHFANNASLTYITNSPLVFAKDWKGIFEKYGLLNDIQSYDAVVLGMINDFSPRNNPPTKYAREMLDYVKRHPSMFDERNWKVLGIGIEDVADVYKGPIVVLPMFSKNAKRREASARETARIWKESGVRSQVQVLNGREHIEALGECGATSVLGVDICHMENAQSMHRCTGPKGGHPDLTAWDLIEALHP